MPLPHDVIVRESFSRVSPALHIAGEAVLHQRNRDRRVRPISRLRDAHAHVDRGGLASTGVAARSIAARAGLALTAAIASAGCPGRRHAGKSPPCSRISRRVHERLMLPLRLLVLSRRVRSAAGNGPAIPAGPSSRRETPARLRGLASAPCVRALSQRSAGDNCRSLRRYRARPPPSYDRRCWRDIRHGSPAARLAECGGDEPGHTGVRIHGEAFVNSSDFGRLPAALSRYATPRDFCAPSLAWIRVVAARPPVVDRRSPRAAPQSSRGGDSWASWLSSERSLSVFYRRRAGALLLSRGRADGVSG